MCFSAAVITVSVKPCLVIVLGTYFSSMHCNLSQLNLTYISCSNDLVIIPSDQVFSLQQWLLHFAKYKYKLFKKSLPSFSSLSVGCPSQWEAIWKQCFKWKWWSTKWPEFHRKDYLMLQPLAGATIQIANFVNYICHPQEGGNYCPWQFEHYKGPWPEAIIYVSGSSDLREVFKGAS